MFTYTQNFWWTNKKAKQIPKKKMYKEAFSLAQRRSFYTETVHLDTIKMCVGVVTVVCCSFSFGFEICGIVLLLLQSIDK